MVPRANVIRARVARHPPNTGGTTAPRAAASGPQIGLGSARVPQKRIGLGSAQPAAGGAPGGSPGGAPPGTPTPTHMPWDAQFQLASGGAEKGYGDQLAYLGAKRTMTQQAYGLDQGFNDYANNPYSRAALLRKSYDTSVRGSTNSYAALGQLYAGSLNNAQSANRSGYDQSYDSLNREYLSSLSNIDREEAEAKATREQEVIEAGWRRLEAAQGEPLEPQTAPEGGQKKTVNHKVKQAVGKARKAR